MYQLPDADYNIDSPDELLVRKRTLIEQYRHATKWACYVMDYKRRFDREEDFGADDIQEHINFLRDDARRELKQVSINIKQMRNAIEAINQRLMDLAKPPEIG